MKDNTLSGYFFLFLWVLLLLPVFLILYLKVKSVRPRITDYALIEYVDENEILGKAIDLDKVCVEQNMPDKIRYKMKYIQSCSVWEYFKVIILITVHVVKSLRPLSAPIKKH